MLLLPSFIRTYLYAPPALVRAPLPSFVHHRPRSCGAHPRLCSACPRLRSACPRLCGACPRSSAPALVFAALAPVGAAPIPMSAPARSFMPIPVRSCLCPLGRACSSVPVPACLCAHSCLSPLVWPSFVLVRTRSDSSALLSAFDGSLCVFSCWLLFLQPSYSSAP
jgi:hypothetical protein